jgi:hypothetical protein
MKMLASSCISKLSEDERLGTKMQLGVSKISSESESLKISCA